MLTPVTRVLADWRFWIALVGTAIAFGVAAIVSGTVDRSWRAETSIVVGTGSGPLRPGEDGATRTLAERLDDLVRSDQIAANVVSTLHLDESRSSLLKRISVGVPEPGLLRIRVKDANRLRAQQIAQEIGFLFPRLIERRFPSLNAPVWDPAHLVGRPARHWGRNLGIAALVAVLLWAIALGPFLLGWFSRVFEARPAQVPVPAAAAAAAPPPPMPTPAPAPAPPPAVSLPEPEPQPEPEPEPEPEPSRNPNRRSLPPSWPTPGTGASPSSSASCASTPESSRIGRRSGRSTSSRSASTPARTAGSLRASTG